MNFHVIESLAQQILDRTSSWAEVADLLTAWVMAPILAGLTIQIMWQGFNIIRGAGGSQHFLDVFAKSLRTFLVVSLALAGGAYGANVVGLLQELRENLTGVFVHGPSTNTYQALDETMGNALSALGTIMNWGLDHINVFSGDFSGVIAIGSGLFMVACMAIYCSVSALNFLLIDLGMQLITGLGPLFVGAFAFQSTARFFDSWLGTALKYILTAVLMVAIVGLANQIVGGFAQRLLASADSIDFVTAAFGALITFGALIGFVWKGPSLAADLVGGIGISLFSPAPAAAAATSAAGNVAGTVGGGAARTAAYTAGKVAQTQPMLDAAAGAQLLGRTLANTTVGQRAVAAAQTMNNLGRAIGGKNATVGSAFRAGAQFERSTGGAGVGTINASNIRPLGKGMQ